MGMLKILFIADVAVILLSFFAYKPLLKSLVKGSIQKKVDKSKWTPKLTIIIPTHNEESNIKKKLMNLANADYPKKCLKILVSDDCSTDKTAYIAGKFEKFPVKLIKSKEHKGKIAAINSALSVADTDIVLLTDADAAIGKNSIKNLIKYFSSGEIGGVTGNIIVKIEPSIYSLGQKVFQDSENELRRCEGILDSVSSMDGRLCAFRKSIIKSIDEGAAADDLELAHQIRKKGHRVVFAEDAAAYENAPTDIVSEFQQKRRRSLYTINVVFRHIDMLFNTKYGYFGTLIFPFRRFFGVLSPFLLLFAAFYLVAVFPYVALGFAVIIILALFSANVRGILTYNALVLFSILISWLDFFLNGCRVKGRWSRAY